MVEYNRNLCIYWCRATSKGRGDGGNRQRNRALSIGQTLRTKLEGGLHGHQKDSPETLGNIQISLDRTVQLRKYFI